MKTETDRNKKPVPLLEQPSVALCPICGKKSYSRSGVHPQCAYSPVKRGARKV